MLSYDLQCRPTQRMRVDCFGCGWSCRCCGSAGYGLFLPTYLYGPPRWDDVYEPMLVALRSDIARGEAGFCRGYVLGTTDQAASEFGICFPNGIEYEDMLRAVVRRFEEGSGWMKPGDTPLHVKVALKNAWPCKK